MVLISMGVSCCCVQDGMNQFIQPQIVSALPDQLMDRDCFFAAQELVQVGSGMKGQPNTEGRT
jgi:hypothetical protein